MKRLVLVALVALAVTASASAEQVPSSPPVDSSLASGSLPSAETPNLSTVLFPQLLVAPAQPQQLTFEELQPIWQAAAQA